MEEGYVGKSMSVRIAIVEGLTVAALTAGISWCNVRTTQIEREHPICTGSVSRIRSTDAPYRCDPGAMASAHQEGNDTVVVCTCPGRP